MQSICMSMIITLLTQIVSRHGGIASRRKPFSKRSAEGGYCTIRVNVSQESPLAQLLPLICFLHILTYPYEHGLMRSCFDMAALGEGISGGNRHKEIVSERKIGIFSKIKEDENYIHRNT